MLDIKFIRENTKIVKKAAKNKEIEVDIDKLLSLDEDRRKLIHKREELRAQQNEASDRIAEAKGAEKKKMIAEMKTVSDQAHESKDKLAEIDVEYNRLMMLVPQIPVKNAPVGGEAKNKEVRKVGDIPKFDFEPKDHLQLGKDLDLIDVERGVKLMGTRGYYLKNEAAQIELALMNYALDFLRERGFTQMATPVFAQRRFFEGTGHFPFAEEETFKVFDQKEREEARLYLIGTSEISLCGYHADEVLDLEKMPLKYGAMTNCFRTEVGSYGKDTTGLYRMKQFMKVEQIIFKDNDDKTSAAVLREIVNNSEEFLQSLELPYRVLQMATGDMGAGKVEMFDIETWMPSRNAYGETHSASNLGDWQARRLNIRYKDGSDKKFCHTLNNTLIASPRILIALLENHQQEDGSVNIPQALRPYLNGLAEIKRK